MASMVAETLAERFWQQVMKRKEKRDVLKGRCTERYALLSYSVRGAHFTPSTTSGHCLSWNEVGKMLQPSANGPTWGAPRPAQALTGKRDLVVRNLQLQGFPRKHQLCRILRFHLLSPWSGVFSDGDSWNGAAPEGLWFCKMGLLSAPRAAEAG